MLFFTRIAALSVSPTKPLTSWTAPLVDQAVKWNNIAIYWPFPTVSLSLLSVTSALSRNVFGGVYLQLYEMGLDQISVFTPLLLHPLHPPPFLISCSHFMMTGNPAGLEGRHLSSRSQEGIFWVKCGDYDLNAPQRRCDPSPASPFPMQIKTMTVKSANHQMYDTHFPRAYYCSARGRGTRFIIMFLPSHQLRWYSTIPFTFSKVKCIHETTRTSIPHGCKSSLYMIVWLGKEATYIINCAVAESQIHTMTLCKTGSYGCNDPWWVYSTV